MEEKFGIRTKTHMLNEIKAKLQSSPNFIITSYKGLDSLAIETLRKKLNKSSSAYFVVKNSIAKRALNELNMKDLSQFVKGEIGIGFTGDLIEASKIFTSFSKENPMLKLNGAFIDGKVEGEDRIKHLAELPPRDVLIALVLSYMQGPISGFVGVMRGLLRNFVYVISEIKKTKTENSEKQVTEGGK